MNVYTLLCCSSHDNWITHATEGLMPAPAGGTEVGVTWAEATQPLRRKYTTTVAQRGTRGMFSSFHNKDRQLCSGFALSSHG